MSSNIKPCRFAEPEPREETPQKLRPSLGSRLTRNIAVATLALLAVVGVREGAPDGFFRAVQTAVESEWDQNVGRLTYVGSTVAETIQVFGPRSASLTSPVRAAVSQAFSQETPYLLYENAGAVYAAAAGEVTQIAHDDEERVIIRVTHDDGWATVYYGLDSCLVREGDAVSADTQLGEAGPVFAFEALRMGKAVDCAASLAVREGAQ